MQVRFVQNISHETQQMLQRIYKESKHHRVRQRAHCVLLSSQGMTINALLHIFDVERLTIYHWFNAWDTDHLAGLYDHKGRGRPPKLTIAEQTKGQQYIEQYPKDIKQVVHLLAQETSKRVSTKTITRLIKKTAMSGNALRKHQKNIPPPSSMSVAKRSSCVSTRVKPLGTVMCGILMDQDFA